MTDPALFVQLIRDATPDTPSRVALGTIDSTAGTLPTVTFDNEATASTKGRPYLASYTPTVGHRVLLVRAGVGQGWVVVGQVVST